ncbi:MULTISPECIES: hypothetical protein [Delftia]|uniref:hypothetical protein n=1 Tax=Delftia TaxID=80865 RepID=UPI00069ADECA|nr:MULTISPECIES: hypothetical protein [Delftia]
MIDREMLEAAASAAGLKITFDEVGTAHTQWNGLPWEPIRRNDDSFRLAAALRIGLEHSAPGIEKPWVAARFKDERREILCNEPVCNESERAEAMRMAILRCAARIGLKNGCERTGSDGNGGAA